MNTAICLFLVIYTAIGLFTLGMVVRYIFSESDSPDPFVIVTFWPIVWAGLVLFGVGVVLDEFCDFCRKGK